MCSSDLFKWPVIPSLFLLMHSQHHVWLSVFSFGTSWIFNSLYDYGGENLTASLLVTIFLILFISIFFIPLGVMVNKDIVTKKIFNFLMPASILVLIELIRSNIFGGFPWLLLKAAIQWAG